MQTLKSFLSFAAFCLLLLILWPWIKPDPQDE